MEGGIAIQELLARADAGERFVLLDVRNAEDFAAWRLEARRSIETIHVPYFDFLEDAEDSIARVPEGSEVVVLCAKGGSSEMVAELLSGAGRRARNVEGGMLAYGNHLEARAVPLPAGSPHEIHQVLRPGRGCLSYVVASKGEALVVDPCRFSAFYGDLVRRLGARIVRAIDTHVHADHLSGGRDLAARAGVPYRAGAVEPETIRVGGIAVEVLPAPGHTPESAVLLVERTHLLSGDTLFAAGVGRPDLGGEVAAWARELYRTLRSRLAQIGDGAVVLPAHFASASEIGADGLVSRRLGELRAAPGAASGDEASFVEAMKASARAAPEAYRRITRVNQGLEPASEEQALEWELGRNECAAQGRREDR